MEGIIPNTTRKLINTNGNNEGIVGKLPTDFIDGHISSVFTEGITMGKKLIKTKQKNDDMSFLPTEVPTEFISSVILLEKSLLNCQHY
jgi:hypothetical protein